MVATKVIAITEINETICPSGCDYTALETCLNTNEGDLVTDDTNLVCDIQGTWSSPDTTEVVIHNYTTDADNDIHILTTGGARHQGVESSSYYQLHTPTDGYSIAVWVDNTIVDGLQIGLDTDGFTDSATAWWLEDGTSGTHTFSNNIVYMVAGSDNYNSARGIRTQYSNSPTMYIYNNMFLKLSGADSYSLDIINYGGGTYYVYNNTMVGQTSTGDTTGYRADKGTHYIKNNISVLHTSGKDFGSFSGATIHASTTKNLSSDTTAPETGTYYDSGSPAFVSASDYHLAGTGTWGLDVGSDLSAEYFADDIDGVTRAGTWDLGADEYVAAGGGSSFVPKIIMY